MFNGWTRYVMISVSLFEAAAQGYLKGYPLNKQ